MKTHILVDNKQWYSDGSMYACGYCYDTAGNLYAAESLCGFFANVEDVYSLEKRLREANGLFSVIIEKDGFCAAGVDRLRSIPLFYTDSGSISDNPHKLFESADIDEEALAFYKSSGSVMPGHTLLNNVHQVMPGCYVIYEQEQWKTGEYCNYLCHRGEEQSVQLYELESAMRRAIMRLTGSIGQRQIVIPLTAGNDSRLILCLLREAGYKNVVCYTVTGPDDTEWETAHATAQHLGYPHYRISPQDPEIQRLTEIGGAEFGRYYRHVGCYTNFVWLFEYAAIKVLKASDLINQDAVFVPGHSGDSFAGSHLVKAHVKPTDTAKTLSRKMMRLGFEYRYSKTVERRLYTYFKHQLAAGVTPISAYQNWIMVHRQAHNIVNSVRAYTFFNHEVRLPLWDNELYDIFARLPYESLRNGRLYCSFAEYIFQRNGAPSAIEYQPVVWWKRWGKYVLKPLLRYRPWSSDSIADPLGEWCLAQPLREELNGSRNTKNFNRYIGINDLISKWYLNRVLEGRG